MLWKGFMAAALTKPESRDDLFDLFMGTTDENNDSSQGEIRVNKLTAEKFKELSSEQKRKLYDDIVSKIRASRQHESK